MNPPWPGLIAYVNRASAFSPHVSARPFRQAGGSSVAVVVQDGVDIDAANFAELIQAGWLRATLKVPLRPGAVIFPQLQEPIAEARLFSDLLGELDAACGRGGGYVFAIVNAEGPFEERPDAARVFLTEYRRLRPGRQTMAVATGSARTVLPELDAAAFRMSWETYNGDGSPIAPTAFLAAYPYRKAWTRFTYGAFGEGWPIAAWTVGAKQARAAGAAQGVTVFPADAVPLEAWPKIGGALTEARLIVRTPT